MKQYETARKTAEIIMSEMGIVEFDEYSGTNNTDEIEKHILRYNEEQELKRLRLSEKSN